MTFTNNCGMRFKTRGKDDLKLTAESDKIKTLTFDLTKDFHCHAFQVL
jgi:hypothetical protein